MTHNRFILFLLLLLLFHWVHSEEPKLVFRAEGKAIEMGFCFGEQFLVVYRSTPKGDQLIGSSSNLNVINTPPLDLQGRTSISEEFSMLGLLITNLTLLDSGIYRTECWVNQTRVKQQRLQLMVCNEETEPEEIAMNQGGEGTELRCNSTSIGQEGTSICWYHETMLTYIPALFLDSSISLKPLMEEFTKAVEVKDSGAVLVINNKVLKNISSFYCVVVRGMTCLSFQNINLPDDTVSTSIFPSLGDRVVLNCPADGNDQQWNTPLGTIDGDSINSNQMHIPVGGFSLVIPAVSENHSGDYSCHSSSLELHYSLVLCPKEKFQEQNIIINETVSLECSFDLDGFQRVLWQRLEPSGQYELIHDSDDRTIPVPEDLRGRVTLTENDSTLTISRVEKKDEGRYRCVILKDPVFLEGSDDYDNDYDEEETGNGENGDGEPSDENYWDTEKCIFKHETLLTQMSNFNVTACVASVVVVVLLLAVGGVVAVAVILIMRRKRTKSNINVNDGCTEMLNLSA